MKLVSTIKYECSKEEAANLMKCVLPEIGSQKSDRSSIKIKDEKKGISFIIESNDLASLRAAFNSITKLLIVYEEMKNVK